MNIRIAIILCIWFNWACQPSTYVKIEQKAPDGTLLFECLLDTAQGKRDTIQKTEYYPNGKVRVKGSFKNNLRHGEWIYYFDNGNIWSQGTFNEGKSHGTFTIYNKDGSLFMKSSYNNGKPDGKWLFYDKNKLVREVHFANDSIVKEVNY
ncbi:MAG: hypothetical protein N2449_09685 [Bacteroidales bacterium]|nr:hypothetical protein [Bacteroidales bacterium]